VSNAIRIVGLTLSLCLAQGCVHAPRVENYEPTLPEEVEAGQASNGAIYQSGHDVALFENPVARHVGDIVTVRLVESTAAQKSSSTTTSKASKADLPGPTVFGRPVTVNGTDILGASLDRNTSFDGAGDSAQSNKLQGDLTVTIAKRLPNGNLVVRGQKWIGINQGREYVRIQGIIRPIDIQPDNSILSTKVADANISYGGQGALADANTMSWLSRFFNSRWIP
jgi:flagellar L-ring protein precursor FlgH